MDPIDMARIDAAVTRAGRACAAIVATELSAAHGPDWLTQVNTERAKRGHSAGRGAHDNRFVLALVAHEPALAGRFDGGKRSAARQLNGIANARAHNEPLSTHDAERAEDFADELAGRLATDRPIAPDARLRTLPLTDEEGVPGAVVGVLVLACIILPGRYQTIAQLTLLALAAAGFWRVLSIERWIARRIIGAIAALAIAAATAFVLSLVGGWLELVGSLLFLVVAWIGAALLAGNWMEIRDAGIDWARRRPAANAAGPPAA